MHYTTTLLKMCKIGENENVKKIGLEKNDQEAKKKKYSENKTMKRRCRLIQRELLVLDRAALKIFARKRGKKLDYYTATQGCCTLVLRVIKFH